VAPAGPPRGHRPGLLAHPRRAPVTGHRNYRVGCDKAADLLGFRTTWTARGAKEFYRVYQQVGLDLAEFEGSRYQRLAHIKRLLEDGLLDADLCVQPPAEEPTPPQPVKSGWTASRGEMIWTAAGHSTPN
jgi:hypothetical protein